MPWSISDLSAFTLRLIAGLRSWFSACTMHQPKSDVIASA